MLKRKGITDKLKKTGTQAPLVQMSSCAYDMHTKPQGTEL